MMVFDFSTIKEDVKCAARRAFQEIIEDNPDRTIYSFALYSDDSAMTICPATNSLEYLAQQTDDDPDSKLYYKYEPAEWEFEGMGAEDFFADICTKVRSYRMTLFDNEKAFKKFQKELYDLCIKVMIELREENFFENFTKKEIILLVSVTEYEFASDRLLEIVKALNSKKVFSEYQSWMATWGK